MLTRQFWIEITPLKILWSPDADLDKAPQLWHAPEGTTAPPSDPRPKPLATPRKPMVEPPSDWRKEAAFSFERLETPTHTVVDEAGYPVPFKARNGSLEAGGIRLEIPSAVPAEPSGRAC